MNYLIDVDTCLLGGDGNFNRKYHEWFCEWGKKNSYGLITKLDFDALYEAVGKDVIYNAFAVYTDNGAKTYIQSQLIGHDDILAEDAHKVAHILPEPLTYYGNDVTLGHMLTGQGNSFCRARQWKEAWKHLKEEAMV